MAARTSSICWRVKPPMFNFAIGEVKREIAHHGVPMYEPMATVDY